MAIFHTYNIAKLDEDLVLDGNFYRPERNFVINEISKTSSGRIADYFFEVEELITNQTNFHSFPIVNYDLPHSLGNILSHGNTIEKISELGSTKKLIKAYDLIISRLRYYLKEICLVPNRKYGQVASTEYVVIRSFSKLNTQILLPYFLSSKIQFIFSCSQRGSAHPRLANKDILNLPLPDFLKANNDLLTEKINSAVINFESSLNLYPEAEQELLERLEWKSFNKEHTLSYKTVSNDIENNARLDAEFYQPKLIKLTSFLQKKGAMQLGNFCGTPKRGISPDYVENGNVHIVNSQHLGSNGIIDFENLEKTNELFYNDSRNQNAILSKHDVLVYATGAYIGRTNCWLESEKAVAGIDCIIIRPDNNICDPVYLALFLNSQVGLMQADQRASGSAQRHLYPNDLINYQVFIPQNKNGKPDVEWQKKLADKVVKSYEAKKEAKTKLKEAIDLVEIEIEKLLRGNVN